MITNNYSSENRAALQGQGKTDDQIADQWAMTNKGFKTNLDKIRAGSKSNPKATTAFLNYYIHGDAKYSPPLPQAPKEEDNSLGWFGSNAVKRFLDKTWENTEKGIDTERDIIARRKSGEIGRTDAFLQGAFNGVSIIGGPAKALWDTALTTDVPLTELSAADAIGAVAKPIMESKPVQEGVMPAVDAWMKYSQENHEAQTLNMAGKAAFDALNVFGSSVLEKPFQATMKTALHPVQAVKGAIKGTAGAVLHPAETFGNIRSAFPAPGTKEVVTKSIQESALIRSGADPRLAKLMVEGGGDASSYKRIVQMYEDAKGDFNAPNPKEVIGETAIMNYRHLDDVRQGVGKMIGNVVEANKINPVALDGSYGKFVEWLNKNNIHVNPETGKLMPSSSRVPKEDIAFLQEIQNRINPNGTTKTFGDAHQTRQWLFKAQDIAKQRQLGYSDLAKDAATEVHSAMLKDMGTLSPAYEKYALPYAETIKAQNVFAQKMGKSEFAEISERELRAGELAKRMTGNASADMTDAFNMLEETARKYGYNGEGSVANQAYFERAISQYFPNFSPGGLQGEMEGAANAIGMTADAARGNVIGLAVKGGKALIGKSPKRQLNLIKKFLSSNTDDLARATSPEEVESILQKLFGEDYIAPQAPKPQNFPAPASVNGESRLIQMKGGKKGTPGIDYPSQPQAQKSVNGGSVGGVETSQAIDDVVARMEPGLSPEVTTAGRARIAEQQRINQPLVDGLAYRQTLAERADKLGVNLSKEEVKGLIGGNERLIKQVETKLLKAESPKALPRDGATTGLIGGSDSVQSKMYYHGSPVLDLDKRGFSPTESLRQGAMGIENKVKSPVTFFSDKYDTAKFFGENRAQFQNKAQHAVYESSLDMKKTLDLSKGIKSQKTIDTFKDAGVDLYDYFGFKNNDLVQPKIPSNLNASASDLWTFFDDNSFVSKLREQGFDSAILKEEKGLGTSIAVLDNKIIKSVNKSPLPSVGGGAEKFINPINKKVWDTGKIPEDWASYTSAQKRTYLDALESFNQSASKVGGGLEPLMKEARKYKSVEQFADNNFVKVYNGSTKEINNIRKGQWFTVNREQAKAHGDIIKEFYLKVDNPVDLRKNPSKKFGDFNVSKGEPDFEIQHTKGFQQDISFKTIDPNKVFTKSQLSDLWKQANQ